MKALVGGTLVDGTGQPPVKDAVVLVEGKRIAGAGRRRDVRLPADADVTDISGLTVLPGLIDTHDHLVAEVYDLAHRWGLAEPLSLKHLKTAQVLQDTLLSGHTTVRDAGWMDAGFKRAIDEGVIPGPRLVVSVNIISATGGIADRFSPAGYVNPGYGDPLIPSGVANGVQEVRAKVREMARAGADVIKIATTGGASSRPGFGPRDSLYTLDEIKAMVEEAHFLGRKVMCHAIGGAGLRLALEAGVDSIEHGCYLDEEPDLIPLMVDQGIVFTPTFTVYIYHRDKGQPFMQQRARELQAHHQTSLQQAMAAGVKVTAGTDAGGYVHGDNANEIQLLSEAGMTPMQAIQAATGWAAEAIGLEKEVGTVERGKQADLLVMNGDPLSDVSMLRDRSRIKLVMKAGKAYVDKLAAAKDQPV